MRKNYKALFIIVASLIVLLVGVFTMPQDSSHTVSAAGGFSDFFDFLFGTSAPSPLASADAVPGTVSPYAESPGATHAAEPSLVPALVRTAVPAPVRVAQVTQAPSSSVQPVFSFVPVEQVLPEVNTSDAGQGDITDKTNAELESNQGKHDYSSNWSSTVESYIQNTKNGYMVLQAIKGNLYITYFDEKYQFLFQKVIQAELSEWGGFYEGADSYYVVWGQDNGSEDNNVEVVRVVQYDKKWNRKKAASLFGANTTSPFVAGSLRMAEYHGFLFIKTCHQMYRTKEDGLRHQASLMIEVRESDMTITGSYHSVSSGGWYVSHSFNQFVQVDDAGNLLMLDHGDSYPRAAQLGKYHIASDGKMEKYNGVKTIEYYGKSGENYTGAMTGGLACSDTHYLTAGASVVQDAGMTTKKVKNVYVTATGRNDFTKEKTTVNWITTYQESGAVTTGNPFLVRITGSRLLLIWAEKGLEDKTTSYIRYAYLDGAGNISGEIHTVKGKLSDCQPIVSGENVIWYVMDDGAVDFYTIDGTGTFAEHVSTFYEMKTLDNCRMFFTKTGAIAKDEVDGTLIILDGEDVLEEGKHFTFNSGKQTQYNGDGVITRVTRGIAGKKHYTGSRQLYAYPVSSKPALKSATVNGTKVQVKWKEEPGALGYLITRKDGNGDTTQKEITDYKTVSWVDSQVKTGMTYTYTLKAYTTDGTKKIYSGASDGKKAVVGTKKKKVQLKKGTKFAGSGFTYVVTKGAVKGKTAEIAILKYSGKKKSLSLGTKKITKNGVKCRITAIGKKAFFKNRRLRSVVFGKSVQKIGAKAFYGCRNLKYIRAKNADPDSIVVGDKAFYGIHKDAKVIF